MHVQSSCFAHKISCFLTLFIVVDVVTLKFPISLRRRSREETPEHDPHNTTFSGDSNGSQKNHKKTLKFKKKFKDHFAR